MKIGVWILADYNPQMGGGFSLYDKLIKLIDDYSFSDEIEVCFIGFRSPSNFNFKKQYICIDFVSNIFSFIKNPHISNKFTLLVLDYYYYILRKFFFLRKGLHAILNKNKIDLIYYPVQTFRAIDDFPFITANWDIGELSTYPFPELQVYKKFATREAWYFKEIQKALMVFAESETGKDEMVRYINYNPEKIEIVPLFPGGVVDMNVSEMDQLKLLSEKKLTQEKFFFYPAQFWAHKNHYNLLLAFKEFNLEFPDIKLVLAGSDKGNKKYLLELVNLLELNQHVEFTGFISNEMLYTLYKNALALVMPTFLGPTNMPLLEARILHCPVLCSDFPGHREIMRDGAIYFSPDNFHSIHDAMKRIIQKIYRDELLIKAEKTLKDTKFNEAFAIKSLNENFVKSKSIRLCWSK